MTNPTAQDAPRSTHASSADLWVDPDFPPTRGTRPITRPKRPWTLPAPWTRRRAHRALENGGPFPTAPTAIIVLVRERERRKTDRKISFAASDRLATITERGCGRQRAHSPTLRRQK
jgi:hypothetical protein